METTLDDFEDILEPRRKEVSNWWWALRDLKTVSPCKHNEKYSPEQIKVEVLKSPKILSLIDKVCQQNVSKVLVIRKLEQILDEIGYSRKLWVIRFLGYVLSQITTRVCRGIFINKESIQNLKCQMGNVPVMYMPSHRSYADFILMSYLLFYYDIDIPAIAAGMDFHGMKGMGTILRNTGAFFMRRSYNSDGLYWDTFREYIHQLVIKGDKGIEFFIEGTRSRTGKTLYPKYGLLTMILRAFFNSEVPDILFVPINLNYDRVMEERLFGFELLGVPKPRESTSGFFKSLRIVQEDFGNVYVNFGTPISARTFFHDKLNRAVHSLNSVHAQSITDAERRATSLLAHKIIESQQKLCVITTFNLIATVMVTNFIRRESIEIDLLCDQVKWLDSILRILGVLTDFDGTTQRLLESINVHCNLIRINEKGTLHLVQDTIVLGNVDKTKLKGHQLSESTMTRALPLVMLQIYVNPVLHYFVNPALVVLILHRSISELHTEKLFEEFNFLRSVFTREFVLFPENSTWAFTESIELLKKLHAVDVVGKMVKLGENERIQKFLFNVLEPFFQSYYIVCCVLKNVKSNNNTERVIMSETQRQIEGLLNNHSNGFMHPYALSLDTISNCLQNLVDLKAIQKIKRGDTYCYEGGNSDIMENIKNKICDYISNVPEGVLYQVAAKL